MLSIVLLLLTAAAARASELTIYSPRFVITSSDATQLRSEQISLSQKPSPPLTVSATDTLKLTFQVIQKDTQTGVQPHQTFLRFYDEQTGEEGIEPVRVTSSGKAKFELNMSRPPTSLPPTTSSPLLLSLLLGSFTHSPSKIDLLTIHLPPSHPPPEDPFTAKPEIVHTFRAEQKVPPKAISAVFALLTLVPWFVLMTLLSSIGPSTRHFFNMSTLSLTLLLTAYETLLVWYWIDLKLGQVLYFGAILGIATVMVGRKALSNVAERRVKQK